MSRPHLALPITPAAPGLDPGRPSSVAGAGAVGVAPARPGATPSEPPGQPGPGAHAVGVTAASAAAPERAPDLDPLALAQERRWVELAQQGDRAAFRELYLRHAPTVLRCAIAPLIREPDIARDVLADTFVRAMEHLGRYRWQPRGLLPWLVRIAKNRALDHLRTRGRVASGGDAFEQWLPDPEPDEGEGFVRRGELGALMQARTTACLDELTPRYREVIELRLREGLPRDVAARRLGVTVGTLDVLLCRACKAFRKRYVARYGATWTELIEP